MRLQRIVISNFRNLANVDIPVRPGAVIVGENRSGKSNLLHALRLVLDPSLPNSDRQLRREDFSDALAAGQDDYDPFAAKAVIEISVEFSDIGDHPQTIAMLGASLIEAEPMRARLVYRFAPRDSANGSTSRQPYDWHILGGPSDGEEEVRGDLRRFLKLTLLSALRDVEGDIFSWRRSPLRPLLEAAAGELGDEALKAVAAAVTLANQQVLELKPIANLTTAITKRTTELVGERHTSSTSLGVAPADPQRLLRTLRLYVDDVSRPLSSASLGTLNVLYLALLQLALAQEVAGQDAAHIVLAIEEPEAHLHPHVQRLVFRDVLRVPDNREQSVIVTTHSPHIVSVTPPKNLIVLRRGPSGTETGVANEADLTQAEWDDIARYLDATRGEMVFAWRVLLVEGFAEAVLVPKLATDLNMSLDKLGVTICAIHGTHFASYARYLSAIGTPWAIATDGDPGKSGRAGDTRAERLLERLQLTGTLADHGIFVGDVTLEADLAALNTSNGKLVAAALATKQWGPQNTQTIDGWLADGVVDTEQLLVLAKRFGKGHLAQRLAAVDDKLDAPLHIARALVHLAR
jgi:putative ATP-dependent endonuclease of OLD family